MEQTIVTHILQAFPTTQAIYLFGSFGTVDERPESDIDYAVLAFAQAMVELPQPEQ